MLQATLVLASALAFSPVLDDTDDEYHVIVGLAEKGLHDMVVREATQFLRDHPSHGKADLARYRLATALFDLDRSADARPHFATLARLDRFEFDDEVAFRHGQCELEAQNLAVAAASFERVRRGDSDYLKTPATYLLGEAYFRQGDFGTAAKHYRATIQAEDAGDYAKDALHGLAWCAYRLEEWDAAVARCDEFLSRHRADPRADELRFLSAESHLEAKRPDRALANYRRVGEGAFHDAALRGAGFACAAQDDHAGAASWFGRLLSEHPDSRYVREATLHKGIHELKGGDARAASTTLRSPNAGGDPEVHYWRARAWAALDEHERALGALDAALAGKPEGDLAARIGTARGDALYELGRTDEAAAAFEESGSDYALHAAAVAKLNDGYPADAIRLALPLVDPERESPYRIEARLTLAEGYFAQGEYEDAEKSFDVVAREDGDAARKARALSRIGWCRYLSGDHATAAARFREVTRRHGDSAEAPEARFMRGRCLEALGRDDDAAEAYRDYLSKHPEGEHRAEAMLRAARQESGEDGERRLAALLASNGDSEFAPQARYDLAERHSRAKRFEEALPHYRAIVENHPRHELAPAARYGAAWAEYSLGAYKEASADLVALAGDGRADADLRIVGLELLVWTRRKLDDGPGARTAFTSFAQACEDEPRRFRAAKVTAAALKASGDLDGAQTVYAELLKRTTDPGVAVGICVERTYLALDQGKPAEAEAQARAAHRYAPEDPELGEAFFFVGEAVFEAGDNAKAAELYALASAAEPNVRARALYKGGFALLRSDDLDGAARAFAELARDHPRSELYGESLFLCGEAHYRAGRYGQAIEWLGRLRKEVPKHDTMAKALFRLGVALARTEEWNGAAETLAALGREHPDFANKNEAELWRGRALAALDQRRGARQAFERVIGNDRGVLSAQARIELGRLSLAAGDREEALAEFLKVAILYAHPEEVAEAQYMAGQVLEAKKDRSGAIERYREAVEDHPDARFSKLAAKRLKALGE